MVYVCTFHVFVKSIWLDCCSCKRAKCDPLLSKSQEEFFNCFLGCWERSRVCVAQCAQNFWNIYAYCSDSHQCPASNVNADTLHVELSSDDVTTSPRRYIQIGSDDVENRKNVSDYKSDGTTTVFSNAIKRLSVDQDAARNTTRNDVIKSANNVMIKPSLGIVIKTSKGRSERRGHIKKITGYSKKTSAHSNASNIQLNARNGFNESSRDAINDNSVNSNAIGPFYRAMAAERVGDVAPGSDVYNCRRACAVRRFTSLRIT